MIPKIIHYCWFGRGPKPELAVKCIDSWKKYCPDYQFVEWNEDNFDINQNLYVKQAYDKRKFAFVTDYVRLHALFTYGGIYMDTDVMVLKNIDQFLEHESFLGFESKSKINTGIIGSKKGHLLIGELLDYYRDKGFLKEDGYMDMTTNVEIITQMLTHKGFIANGEYQIIDGFALYPQNIFCPDHKKLNDHLYMKETYTIHYFAGSWKSEKTKKREKSLWWRIVALLGQFVSKIMKKYFGNSWVVWKNNFRDKMFQDKSK